ncbi:MAG: hypothetical protein GF344_13775 [Chitinivibrionales bacterium]|nr:hypothetical protein [Chitinivibrionales bacterium]MBD3357799.1 hypothetical protein [Chitinivibrionales bacterium]
MFLIYLHRPKGDNAGCPILDNPTTKLRHLSSRRTIRPTEKSPRFSRKAWYWFIPIFAALFLTQCLPNPKSIRMLFASPPKWIKRRPTLSTHFVGIGGAKIKGNLYKAQRRARAAAFDEIAEQITVSVCATKVLEAKSIVDSNGAAHEGVWYHSNIHTSSAMDLSSWETAETWYSPDGYVWIMVIVNKAHYYERINRQSNAAARAVANALRNASKGPLISRLRELHRAMLLFDTLPDSLYASDLSADLMHLRDRVNGEIEEALLDVELRPNAHSLAFSPIQRIPDTVGVQVLVDNVPDISVPIRWSVSSGRAVITPIGYGHGGRAKLRIHSLPASINPVALTASLDMGTLGYDLLRRGFKIPSCKIFLRRRRMRLHSVGLNAFGRALVDTLANLGEIIPVISPTGDHSMIRAELKMTDLPRLSDGSHYAYGELLLELTHEKRGSLLTFRKTVRSPLSSSANEAEEKLRSFALATAVVEIESIF